MEPNFPTSSPSPEMREVIPGLEKPVQAEAAGALNHGPEKTPLPEREPMSPQAVPAPVAMPQLPSLPVPQPLSQAQPLSKVVNSNPLSASDEEVIEKEWVDKAKKIVIDTKDDPYAQEKEVSLLQADYLKKRYGKEIKLVDE